MVVCAPSSIACGSMSEVAKTVSFRALERVASEMAADGSQRCGGSRPSLSFEPCVTHLSVSRVSAPFRQRLLLAFGRVVLIWWEPAVTG